MQAAAEAQWRITRRFEPRTSRRQIIAPPAAKPCFDIHNESSPPRNMCRKADIAVSLLPATLTHS
ncbi:MAG: hypothetical protein IPL35_15025 [Sphingobacteriales bacterium]|nr:hypothetical protein [Sphingobacteriales bacterium]